MIFWSSHYLPILFSVCPLTLTGLPTFGKLSYQISDTCDDVNICVPVPELSRNIKAFLDIQACESVITVGIEEFKFTMTFGDFKWGEEQLLYLVISFYYLRNAGTAVLKMFRT